MHIKLSASMAAICILAAGCLNENPEEPSSSEAGSIQILVRASEPGLSRVSFGQASGNTIPMVWSSSGEELNLSEFLNKSRSQDKGSSAYRKQTDSTAEFSFQLDSKTSSGTYDYVAISPKSCARTTGTAAAKKGRASFALAPTAVQKPTSDGPDPSTIIIAAKSTGHSSQPSELDLQFTHQCAYSQMTVVNFPALEAGETVSSIRISAAAGTYLTGRLWYDYSEESYAEYDGSMKEYVDIDPSLLDINSTSFVIWWTSLPVTVPSGSALNLSAATSAGRTLSGEIKLAKDLKLQKGVAARYTFNWTKGQAKVLDFDFSTKPSGWPDTPSAGSSYAYGDYTFTIDGYDNSNGSRRNRISYNSTSHFLTVNYGAFLGLPAIENYRLAKVALTHSASKSSGRQGGVVYGIRHFCDSVEFVTAGGKTGALWNVSPGTVVEMPILTGLSGHQYFITCTSGGLGISHLKLTYEYDPGVDADRQKDAFTVGNLNVWMPSVRTSKKESGLAPAEREWEYARYNVRDIIKDSGFDILGTQETTLRVRNDIKTDLASLDKYSYKYFLHKPSTPDNSSSVGIIYNKKRFELSDDHQFWLSETPDVQGSQRPDESSVRSVGCAVLKDKNSGKRYFVMVVHASLDDDSNSLDADLVLARVSQYNTEGLPVILLGDFNANWSMPMYTKLSSAFSDARFSVELAPEEISYPGTYNGPAGTFGNLSQRANRIDWIFTKDCEVFSYRVNRSRYTAGNTVQFPSDHCPPVVRCR